MSTETAKQIKDNVRQRYGEVAANVAAQTNPASCCRPSQAAGCCGSSQASNATRLYDADEIAGLPDSVTDASLGCGDPLAIASLRPGEVVLDLGAGGGIDCFLAAQRVGPTGRVIGLDMTPEMVRLARRNARKMGVTNVDFRWAEMEEMPLPDASVDVIISNCVINLSPDKDAVFAEAFRVLRPGGRLAVSDIVTYGELPAFVRDSPEAWAGCVAGALDERDYLDKIRAAGFTDVTVTARNYAEVDALAGSPEVRQALGDVRLDASHLQGKIASVKVMARKPA
jgi:arsenite methyltransferase